MTKTQSFLPYTRQLIEEDDIAAVTKVLKGDFLTSGPTVPAFEEKLSQVAGASFAVGCSSGTAALHLAALALKLQPGDLVIVPAITFLATASAIRYVGAEVAFADVDAGSGLITAQHIYELLEKGGKKIKAIFPVHLGGQSPDMEAIHDIATKHGLAIVEDASHAIGSTYSFSQVENKVGSCEFSDMATFSFHPAKTVAMGEGGAITTQNSELAGRLRLLLNHGMIREPCNFVNEDMAYDSGKEKNELNPWYYEMQEIGFNYRISDIHCALGLAQLSKLEKFVEKTTSLVRYYDKLLSPFSPIVEPVTRVKYSTPAWHLYQVLIDFEEAGITRAQLMKELQRRGIGTQVHYIPVPCQPYYKDRYRIGSFPGAEAFYKRSLSLPLFAGMNDFQVESVTEALGHILNI